MELSWGLVDLTRLSVIQGNLLHESAANFYSHQGLSSSLSQHWAGAGGGSNQQGVVPEGKIMVSPFYSLAARIS